MPAILKKFWAWYEKFYALNLTITAGLFLLQLAHLYWLTTHIVLYRLTGTDFFFAHSRILTFLIILADYAEIPALIATSILYTKLYRERKSIKPILFLLLINSQWIHLFWLTDEVALGIFFGAGAHLVTLNPVVAWIAIAIDYLELPVIFDTLREVAATRSWKTALEIIKSKD